MDKAIMGGGELMPVSEALKIARISAKTVRDHDMMILAREAMPVIELIAGVSILEFQARHGNIGSVALVPALGALYAIIGVQVLAPTLPTISTGSKDIIDGITKALPVLAAVAA